MKRKLTALFLAAALMASYDSHACTNILVSKVQPQMVQPWSPIRPTHISYTDASISIRQLPIRLEP